MNPVHKNSHNTGFKNKCYEDINNRISKENGGVHVLV
jgi:hypothetical protein